MKMHRQIEAPQVIYVSEDGAARLAAESLRVAETKALGVVPPNCGHEAPVAPARGPVRITSPIEAVPGELGKFRPAGFQGRNVMRRASVFDVMEGNAAKAHKRALAKNKDAEFVPPFSSTQIAIGMHYIALYEKLLAGGMRGSDFGDRVSGGGGGRDAVDLRLAMKAELDAMEMRVGRGVSMQLRKVRPSARGSSDSKTIGDLMAIQKLLREEKTVSEILRCFGWKTHKDNVKRLREALRASLDRMAGFA